MSGSGIDIRVTGLDEVLAALGALDHKGLTKLASASMKRSSKGLITAIRREAPIGPSPHASSDRGKRGRKGPLSRNVTARQVRTRQGEMVAISVAPRAWYKHFVIRGTRRHVIEASAGGVRATGSQVRAINRLERDEYVSARVVRRRGEVIGRTRALIIANTFRTRVEHPGARGDDFVARAARGQVAVFRAALARDIEARFEAAAQAA